MRLLDQGTKGGGGGGEKGLVLDGAKTIAAEGKCSWIVEKQIGSDSAD